MSIGVFNSGSHIFVQPEEGLFYKKLTRKRDISLDTEMNFYCPVNFKTTTLTYCRLPIDFGLIYLKAE